MRTALHLTTFAFLLLIATPASAATYNVCVRFSIKTVDSAPATKTPREDHYVGANTNPYFVTAHGVKVRAYKNGTPLFAETFTSQTTGCHTFTTSQATPLDFRVWTWSKINNNNFRLHDGAVDDYSSLPGNTYSNFYAGLSPSNGTFTINAGGAGTGWTAMAAGAFTLYRIPEVTGKIINVADNYDGEEDGCGSNAGDGDWLHLNRAYIDLAAVRPGSLCQIEHRNFKFIVAHEIGHTLGMLYSRKQSFPRDGGFVPDANKGCAPQDITNPEANAVTYSGRAFYEGFAEFIGARVFNDPVNGDRGWKYYTGSNTASGMGFELENYVNTGPLAGGRILNVCGYPAYPSDTRGIGVIEDWTRFFWDWHMNSSCGALGMLATFQMYNYMEFHSSEYTKTEGWKAANDAAIGLHGANSCKHNLIKQAGCWNGVARGTSGVTSPCGAM